MKTQRTRLKAPGGTFIRINVLLTQSQLDMVNQVSHCLGRNRSDVIREGIGEVLDRYERFITEVPR